MEIESFPPVSTNWIRNRTRIAVTFIPQLLTNAFLLQNFITYPFFILSMLQTTQSFKQCFNRIKNRPFFSFLKSGCHSIYKYSNLISSLFLSLKKLQHFFFQPLFRSLLSIILNWWKMIGSAVSKRNILRMLSFGKLCEVLSLSMVRWI